ALESVWKFVTAPLPASSSRWAGGVRLCVGTWVAVAGWRRLVMDGRGYGHTAGTGVGHVSLGCTAGTPLHRAVLAAWLRAGESSAWRILMSRTPRRLSAGCPPAGRLLVVGVALPVDGGYTAR
ncbi:MAG: hypothetical protein WAN44_18655, partial [Propionibacteriaceae bacterium]